MLIFPEGDDRKRGYNSMTTIDVSLEDMEVKKGVELRWYEIRWDKLRWDKTRDKIDEEKMIRWDKLRWDKTRQDKGKDWWGEDHMVNRSKRETIHFL